MKLNIKPLSVVTNFPKILLFIAVGFLVLLSTQISIAQPSFLYTTSGSVYDDDSSDDTSSDDTSSDDTSSDDTSSDDTSSDDTSSDDTSSDDTSSDDTSSDDTSSDDTSSDDTSSDDTSSDDTSSDDDSSSEVCIAGDDKSSDDGSSDDCLCEPGIDVSISPAKISQAEPMDPDVDYLYTVSLNKASTVCDISVNVATADGAGMPYANATASIDYIPISSTTITFAVSEVTKNVNVKVLQDDTLESVDEAFSVNLSDPVNAKIVIGSSIGVILGESP